MIDIRSLLPTVGVPTLILHSTRDPLLPVAAGRLVAGLIPGATIIERDADYHMTYNGASAWFLDEVEDYLTGGRHEPTEQTDRFLATVLFTDIVGSTQKAASMGDRAWRELLDRHDAIAAERVKEHGGRVVKTTGDGVLATLDGPSRAVECALSIREALRALELDMRAGVHTGEVERRGDDIGGIGVNIGSRIATLAGAGEVWVSRTVKDLTAGSDFRFEERGRHALKGVPEEWDLYSFAS